MLGDRSRYVLGLSQVAVSTSALQVSRMDDDAALHSEWLLLHLCEFDGMSNIPTSHYSSSLSEGKFRHKSEQPRSLASNMFAFL